MIASLRGPILEIGLDHLVIDCAGVGYRVLATPPTLATLRRGEDATLITAMVVREDAMTLYGFTDPDAKALFALLQTVTGVGPKLAMAALAVLEPQQLRRALADSDTKMLTTVPGVGKRMAERLIVELRDKAGPAEDGAVPGTVRRGSVGDQVVEALVGLGFTAAAAEKTVGVILAENPAADASAALRESLSALGKTK